MSILGRVNLSNENYEGPAIDSTETIIEGDLAYADAMELAQEAKLDAQAMMTLEDATQALEAKISNEEYLLANPEKITTEVVALANESYGIVCTILGGEAESLSVESIESSPVSAMNISHEDVKDFLKKLYDSIKLLFKKIGNAIKKIVVKLVVAMNGVEKAAKKLQDKLKKSSNDTPKETNLKDKDAKVWVKYFQAIAKLSGNDNVNDAASELLDFYNVKLNNELNAVVNGVIEIGDNINKIDIVDDGSFAYNIKLDEITKKLSADIIKFTWGEKIVNNLDLGDSENIIIINPINDKVKGIIIEIEENDKNNKKLDIKFKVGNIAIKSDAITSDDVAAVKPTELLAKLITTAKGLKKFSDNRMKEIDNMYKELDKQAEKKTSNAVSKFMLKQKASFGTNIRALVAGAYLDSVLGYSTATKKVLAYCRDQAAMFNANEL